jgi:predicted glutamine amidotransferase
MCRMYGHIAARPLPVDGVLLDQPHALLAQSCGDWRGEKHPDGWGIGYVEGEQPRVIRRPTAAAQDAEFSAAARRIESPTVIAHVRQASVGDLCVANAHPFTYGRWIFVHNGTVTGFDALRAGLVAETDGDLRQQVGGTTDSEQVFFWLLSRLRKAGQTAEGPCTDVTLVARELATAIAELARRSAATQPDAPSRLNFLLTDGAVLIGSRWLHSLYWTNCAGPLLSGDSGSACRGLAVASETIGEQPWAEVPDRTVFSVDRDFVVRWLPIAE